MHPLSFYRASTSAIETLEKKTTLSSASLEPSTLHTASIDVCRVVCVCLCESVTKVHVKFLTQVPNLKKEEKNS